MRVQVPLDRESLSIVQSRTHPFGRVVKWDHSCSASNNRGFDSRRVHRACSASGSTSRLQREGRGSIPRRSMSMNHRRGHGFGQAQMPLVGLASKWDWPATVNRVSQTRRFDSSPTHPK